VGIGVHAPEFIFEKTINNVRSAVKAMRVDYPVAADSEHVIWQAFKNQYWPALYFIDTQGHVRYHHFGEGSYEQSEMIIQELLAEAGMGGIDREPGSFSSHYYRRIMVSFNQFRLWVVGVCGIDRGKVEPQ
jgi:hypothetical protein